MKQPTLAYLVSQYPAISHTFILREVRRLRALGLQINTASINRPDRTADRLDSDEAEEAEGTFYIKEQGFFNALAAMTKCLLTAPLRFCRAVKTAFVLAGWDVFRIAKHMAYLAEGALLGEWMLSLETTHVHVHFANPASTVALLAAQLFPITYSITVHGPDEFYDVTLNSLPEKVRHARFVVCISYYAQSQLMKVSSISQWYKFNVIRLGVDTDIFSPPFEPVRLRPCQILCVGRLVPSKGQQILVAAFNKLVKKGKDVHLRFIGGGPDRANLEKEVEARDLQERVHFHGPLNPWEVVEAYKYADIVALPSFAEGLPVVLMEAMAMEIPCVASSINGIPELIRHNVEGLLVAPSNIEQLAQALEVLVDDEELRQRFGRAGRERVLEKYNLEENINILCHYIKNLIPQERT